MAIDVAAKNISVQSKSMGKGLSCLNASADFSAELMCSVPYFDSYSTKKKFSFSSL